jgi:hypothetical protein
LLEDHTEANQVALDEKTLDAAYEIYEEFGPLRRIPRRERLGQIFPRLTDVELDTLMDEMKRISQTVRSIAERGGDSTLGKEGVITALQARHPHLRGGGLTQATTMVTYVTVHEGYQR